MKQIPNIFTLLNLFSGCIAIVLVLQNGIVTGTDPNGSTFLFLPEQICLASGFIALGAIIDFLDGFVARLLKVPSEMGKQLDSLADVVTFGVAPAMIVYQFLRMSFASQPDGIETATIWLLPAFVIPCAGAYRLARFNIDNSQSYGFKGVPIPAAGLLIASFPLLYWYPASPAISALLLNSFFWYAVVAITSYLMVSTLPMMAFKFKDYSFKNNIPKLVVAGSALIAALLLGWLAVPVVFVVYVVVSLATAPKSLEAGQ